MFRRTVIERSAESALSDCCNWLALHQTARKDDCEGNQSRVGHKRAKPAPAEMGELSPQGAGTSAWFCALRYSDFSTKSLSALDSAPQISPLRPASCRTLAYRSGSGKDSNFSLLGSNRSIAFDPQSLTHTIS